MQWLARLPRAQAADFTTTSSSRHINADRTGCFFTSIFPQVSDFSHAMLLIAKYCKSAAVIRITHDFWLSESWDIRTYVCAPKATFSAEVHCWDGCKNYFRIMNANVELISDGRLRLRPLTYSNLFSFFSNPSFYSAWLPFLLYGYYSSWRPSSSTYYFGIELKN